MVRTAATNADTASSQDSEEQMPASTTLTAAKSEPLSLQELIDNTGNLAECPTEHAIMICGATGTWSRLAKTHPGLANDPLKAFEMLNNTQYTAMREYFNHRRIHDGTEETNAVWK
ncbi:MAG: hypothetical protein J5861_07670 [Desulfovibrio sp.]|nr:hypothetical protein [Desulfovibrio sp.]